MFITLDDTRAINVDHIVRMEIRENKTPGWSLVFLLTHDYMPESVPFATFEEAKDMLAYLAKEIARGRR